jgi:hypothetical protein
MELRIDEAQGDMDAVDLYEDLREEDMLEILGLMSHPRDAVYMSYATVLRTRTTICTAHLE